MCHLTTCSACSSHTIHKKKGNANPMTSRVEDTINTRYSNQTWILWRKNINDRIPSYEWLYWLPTDVSPYRWPDQESWLAACCRRQGMRPKPLRFFPNNSPPEPSRIKTVSKTIAGDHSNQNLICCVNIWGYMLLGAIVGSVYYCATPYRWSDAASWLAARCRQRRLAGLLPE